MLNIFYVYTYVYFANSCKFAYTPTAAETEKGREEDQSKLLVLFGRHCLALYNKFRMSSQRGREVLRGIVLHKRKGGSCKVSNCAGCVMVYRLVVVVVNASYDLLYSD